MLKRALSISAFLLSTIAGLPSMANELAVGNDAKTNAPVTVPLNKPVDLKWKTRDEILEMRFQSLARSAILIKGVYQPNPEVFQWIEDKKPWWGTAGAAVFGAGEKSILGPSEESRFILNPLLLVGVNSASNDIWDPKKITENDINNPEFPFFWTPDRLEIEPRAARGTVRYNVTDYMHLINGLRRLKQPTIIADFSLVAYNARDFGYNWIHVNLRKSSNIANSHDSATPVPIRQMIHCGGTCGYPGGCNNMSPFTAEIDRLRFTDLPASAVVSLWRQRPASMDQTPDFTMVIEIK